MGEGGMGAVYEVHHEIVGGRFALKCLHPQHATNPEIVKRFIQEARAASAIGSEHIVMVTDGGQLENGAPYLVMEYLEGEDLASLLKREGCLKQPRAVGLMLQVCEALAPVHERGIVHRDLKPGNLFLTKRENYGEWLKVLDFGIAKVRAGVLGKSAAMTRTGAALGTPYYMAPEQFLGTRHVDHRADVYAAGVILYLMLTGARPFDAASYEELVVEVATGTPRPLLEVRPDVDEYLAAAVMTTLSRDPDDRFQTMRELSAALEVHTGATSRAAFPEAVVGASTGPTQEREIPATQEQRANPLPATRVAPVPPTEVQPLHFGQSPFLATKKAVDPAQGGQADRPPRSARRPQQPPVENPSFPAEPQRRRQRQRASSRPPQKAAIKLPKYAPPPVVFSGAPQPVQPEVTPRRSGLWIWAIVASTTTIHLLVVLGGGAVIFFDIFSEDYQRWRVNRTISGAPEAATPLPHVEGVHFDPSSGLYWQNPPSTEEHDWRSAMSYCSGLSLAGHGPGSWHLPTISELRTLARGCTSGVTGSTCRVTDTCLASGCQDIACVGCQPGGGPGYSGAYLPPPVVGPTSRMFYWSSSSLRGRPAWAWQVNFGVGGVIRRRKSERSPVRCVRRSPYTISDGVVFRLFEGERSIRRASE